MILEHEEIENEEMVHIVSNGSVGTIKIGSGSSTITYEDLEAEYSSLPGLKFVFIEAPYAGQNGYFADVLNEMGVDSSITFRQDISAANSYDGIHFYASRVYYYLQR